MNPIDAFGASAAALAVGVALVAGGWMVYRGHRWWRAVGTVVEHQQFLRQLGRVIRS